MTRAMLKRLFMTASLWVLLTASTALSTGAADIYLRAESTTKLMPDGQSVVMWGYVLTDATFTPLAGETVKVPGPRIELAPAETALNIHLYNALPEPTSIVISGLPFTPVPTWTDNSVGPRANVAQRVRSFVHETAPNTSSVYSFTSLKPGTFIYESGTHPSVQIQMGLYGCLTQDAAAGVAYAGVSYDNEAVAFFSQVDPGLHAAVATGTYGTAPYSSTIGYAPKYYLINGAPYPDALLTYLHPPWVGERILLRFLSTSLETHVPVINNLLMTIFAEDASPLPYPKEQYSFILTAGKTMDAIVTPTDLASYAIYDRRGRLTNGPATLLSGPQSPGGMITSLAIACGSALIPGRVGDTLLVTQSAGNITLNWSDVPLASGYNVYQSTSPLPASFTTLAGTSSSGAIGFTEPLPPDNLVYFLISATSLCGEGAKL